jgi:hypothetical protein
MHYARFYCIALELKDKSLPMTPSRPWQLPPKTRADDAICAFHDLQWLKANQNYLDLPFSQNSLYFHRPVTFFV